MLIMGWSLSSGPPQSWPQLCEPGANHSRFTDENLEAGKTTCSRSQPVHPTLTSVVRRHLPPPPRTPLPTHVLQRAAQKMPQVTTPGVMESQSLTWKRATGPGVCFAHELTDQLRKGLSPTPLCRLGRPAGVSPGSAQGSTLGVKQDRVQGPTRPGMCSRENEFLSPRPPVWSSRSPLGCYWVEEIMSRL